MNIQWICVICVVTTIAVSATSRSVHIVCNGQICLYLYESTDRSINWQESYDACRDEGLQMAHIDSISVQSAVATLLRVVPTSTEGQVWISGRGSSVETWKYMDGTTFPYSDTIVDAKADGNCLYAKVYSNTALGITYHSGNCDQTGVASRLLCQQDPSKTVECKSADLSYKGLCYYKTGYSAEEQRKLDWFGAQSACSENNMPRDVAYSYFGEEEFRSFILLIFGATEVIPTWLGVRRRIWYWQTGPAISDVSPINYFNWIDGAGRKSNADECICINHGDGNRWATHSCGQQLKYFICMNESRSVKSFTPSTRSVTTTVITTRDSMLTSASKSRLETAARDTEPNDFPVTTKSDSNSGNITPSILLPSFATTTASNVIGRNGTTFKLVYLSAIAAGIVLAAGAVGLFICIRRRKREDTDSTNENAKATTIEAALDNSGVNREDPDAFYHEINDVTPAQSSSNTTTNSSLHKRKSDTVPVYEELDMVANTQLKGNETEREELYDQTRHYANLANQPATVDRLNK